MTNVFLPIDTNPPPSFVGARDDHPAPRLGITQNAPIPTNKFYANIFLGAQNQGTCTHPYSVAWSQGAGNAGSWGLSISHIDASQRDFAPGDPPQYYINPIRIQSVILSAFELGNGAVVKSDSLKAFSANVHLHPNAGAPPAITFPLVQGMGFVTGIYAGARPLIQSSVFFRAVNRAADFNRDGINKYRVVLEDGKNWLVYVTRTGGGNIDFRVASNTRLEATGSFTGFIQAAKNPGGAHHEGVYDASAGVFPIGLNFSGFVKGDLGSYTFRWTKGGVDLDNRRLIMFALPHHVESFDPDTQRQQTTLQLQTTTKGIATAVLRDTWTIVERDIPLSIGFGPCSPDARRPSQISDSAIRTIKPIADGEVSQDMGAQTNLDSMYFSGKALAKFAMLIVTIHDELKDPDRARAGLERLKAAFSLFAQNRQKFPLVYERAWKGVVSTAAYVTGDALVDFGNSYYNDHHFHYGYHVYAAAVIGYLDPGWLKANREWVNMLLRDAANSIDDDPYFPFSRGFDWYHGHSWAKGLFESADGKDEESSSEDVFFAYAIKMWGRTIGDASIEGRGALMLSLLKRTLRNYFLMEDSNRNHPANFVGNKVTGILFENKVDHATYFGIQTEFVHGIHMIPIHPATALTRSPTFVREEWERYFSNGRVEKAEGGWRGILFANLALVDPAASWRFFTQSNFSQDWIDGGATRTCYLVFAAAALHGRGL